MKEIEQQIVDGLSRLIAISRARHSSESQYPGHDVDASEEKLRKLSAHIVGYSELRTKFEELTYSQGD